MVIPNRLFELYAMAPTAPFGATFGHSSEEKSGLGSWEWGELRSPRPNPIKIIFRARVARQNRLRYVPFRDQTGSTKTAQGPINILTGCSGYWKTCVLIQLHSYSGIVNHQFRNQHEIASKIQMPASNCQGNT